MTHQLIFMTKDFIKDIFTRINKYVFYQQLNEHIKQNPIKDIEVEKIIDEQIDQDSFYTIQSQTPYNSFQSLYDVKSSSNQSYRSFKSVQSRFSNQSIPQIQQKTPHEIIYNYFDDQLSIGGQIQPDEIKPLNQKFQKGSIYLNEKYQYGYQIYLKKDLSIFNNLINILNQKEQLEKLWSGEINTQQKDPLNQTELFEYTICMNDFSCKRTVSLDCTGYNELWKGNNIYRQIHIEKTDKLKIKIVLIIILKQEQNFANYVIQQQMKNVQNIIENL